jgi:hypothetical protein
MKRKQFFKLFLILTIIAVFTLFLNGCLVLLPVTPIVEINITNDNWTYDIYVDGSYQGITNSSGKLTLYNVTPGYHQFEAFESPSVLGRYGDKWQTIINGYNKVNINTY